LGIIVKRSRKVLLLTPLLGESVHKHIIEKFNLRTEEIPSDLATLTLFLDPRFRRGVRTETARHVKPIFTTGMAIMMDAGYSISKCELLCQQLGAYLKQFSAYNTCSYGRPNVSVKNWWDCVPLTLEPFM
jgi:hypothetical protein